MRLVCVHIGLEGAFLYGGAAAELPWEGEGEEDAAESTEGQEEADE